MVSRPFDELPRQLQRRGRLRVGVLDSGIDLTHPLLANYDTSGTEAYEVVPRGTQWVLREAPLAGQTDARLHGTLVAAALLGVFSEVDICSYRVPIAFSDAVAFSARDAMKRDCRILLCSFSVRDVPFAERSADPAMLAETTLRCYKSWIDEAYLANVHVVAAADNAGDWCVSWPAHFSSVIAVGTRGERPGPLYVRTGFNSGRTLVEFEANGVPPGDASETAVVQTSFAAPRVAGMLARLLSTAPDVACLTAKAKLESMAERVAPPASATRRVVVVGPSSSGR